MPTKLPQEFVDFVISQEGGNAMSRSSADAKYFLLCSNCFNDQGLRLAAERLGIADESSCQNCGTKIGKKLTKILIARLAQDYFVWGSLHRCEYGAAPIIQFNEYQKTDIDAPSWLQQDLRLIEHAIGVGFFHYGPRLWMIGEVEPLKALQDPATRSSVIDRIIAEYPKILLTTDQLFYRLRKRPTRPSDFCEYDSPPAAKAGSSRLDINGLPVMYGSQDLEVCIHECRVTAEDESYVATVAPARDLKLLDVAELLQEDVSEFESLDMAVHMLFLAGDHSYEIAREIAAAAHKAGYDGLVYPSYFSLLRTGAMPFETSYGISHRKFPQLADREKAKMIRNLALFGRPIADHRVTVKCIDRLILKQVAYDVQFGPVGYESG